LQKKKYGQRTQACAAAAGAAAAVVRNAGSQIRFGDLHPPNTNKATRRGGGKYAANLTWVK